jgi:hypothetical protein
MLRHAPSACVGLVLLATAACAGTLRGSAAPRATAPGMERPDPRDVVIWLEAIPARSERVLALGTSPGWFRRRIPERAPALVQSGLRYEPSVVAVVVGRPVEVRNQDSVWHGAFSVTPGNGFDLGKRPPGRVDSIRFSRPGVVTVRCDIHPSMSATVVVTPNHARVRPDASGRWQLPPVPKGRYVLRAWAPGLEEIRREVRVPRWGFADVALRW